MQEALMPIHLAAFLAVPELVLLLTRRSKAEKAMAQDGGTLSQCWAGIIASMVCASVIAILTINLGRDTYLSFTLTRLDYLGVGGVFVLGFLLRLWAIWSLGKLFTVDVASFGQHTLVDCGPFRFIRHPSYAGLVMEITAFAVSLLNWASLILVTITTFLVLRRRILLEEQVLCMRLEERYRAYRRRTYRMIPFIW